MTVALTASASRSGQPAFREDIAAELVARGYENVAVSGDDQDVIIWCEHRGVRYPVVWMIEAMALAAERAPAEATLRVVAERWGRPVVALDAPAAVVRDWVSGDISDDALRSRMDVEFAGNEEPPGVRNPSHRRVDIEVGPGRLLTQFGSPRGYVSINLDVGAAVRTTALPGVGLFGQVFVPLHNVGFPPGNEARNREIRPGTMAASYLFAPSERSFITATAGWFESGDQSFDSYGVELDVAQFNALGNWEIGGSLGLTAFMSYQVERRDTGLRRVIFVSDEPPNEVTYTARLAYRFEPAEFTTTLRWGKYLGGDHAWRVDMERTFGEIAVTVFAIKSNSKFRGIKWPEPEGVRLLAGVKLEVPIFPRRRSSPAALRIVPPRSYAWTSRYRSIRVAMHTDTRHAVNDMLDGYFPTEIRSNLDRARALISSDVRQNMGRE